MYKEIDKKVFEEYENASIKLYREIKRILIKYAKAKIEDESLITFIEHFSTTVDIYLEEYFKELTIESIMFCGKLIGSEMEKFKREAIAIALKEKSEGEDHE